MFTASELMAKHGISAVFSDSHDGVSKGVFSSLNLGLGLGDTDGCVEKNLALVCEAVNISKPYQAQQVHGVEALYFEGDDVLCEKQADILLTGSSQKTVGVRTADCLPVLLADTETGIVAAVHAGWRGSAANVVGIAVDEMCARGVKVESIIASLGPHIAPCCFEVSDDVGQILSTACGHDVVQVKGASFFADLAKINVQQLLNKGLKHQYIEVSSSCTVCCSKPKYFSYRRDCGKTGRQIAMITAP